MTGLPARHGLYAGALRRDFLEDSHPNPKDDHGTVEQPNPEQTGGQKSRDSEVLEVLHADTHLIR